MAHVVCGLQRLQPAAHAAAPRARTPPDQFAGKGSWRRVGTQVPRMPLSPPRTYAAPSASSCTRTPPKPALTSLPRGSEAEKRPPRDSQKGRHRLSRTAMRGARLLAALTASALPIVSALVPAPMASPFAARAPRGLRTSRAGKLHHRALVVHMQPPRNATLRCYRSTSPARSHLLATLIVPVPACLLWLHRGISYQGRHEQE